MTRYELREQVCGADGPRGGPRRRSANSSSSTDGGASVEGEGHRYRPWGFRGGADGQPAELSLVRAGGVANEMPSKVPHTAVRAGDRFVCSGPAGGGYYDAFTRAAGKVLDDVLDGLISADSARADFGVAITPGGTVDTTQTAALRGTRG